jgi:hypothetical protein
VRAPDLLRPCLSRLSCLSSVSSLSPLAILLCICTYLHVKSRTVKDSFPGDVLGTAARSACRRAVEVAMESRASTQVDAASRGPDNLHSRNDKKAFFSIHAEPGLSSVLDPSLTDKKQPDHYYHYPVTLAHHLTIRFRATICIKLHLRLPASTESESERTVRGGSTAGGSRFNHTQGEDPSAPGPVQAACPSQESFEPTPSASRSSVPQPLGPLQA